MPSALVSMVTKKIFGAVLSLLVREAQKVSTAEAEAEDAARSGGAPPAENVYLKRVAERGSFYTHVEGLCAKYFELFGEEDG